MTTSQKIIGVIAILALVVGIWAKLTPAQEVSTVGTSYGAISNTNAPAANTVLVNGALLPNPTVLDYVVSRVFLYADKAIGYGNSSGTPILQQGVRASITASSSVDCSLQNPFTTATSTYEFSANIASSSANAASLIVATGAGAGATSTLNATVAYSANSWLTIATQGTTTTNLAGVVAPGAWLNLGALTGGSATLAQLGGACSAIFTSTN